MGDRDEVINDYIRSLESYITPRLDADEYQRKSIAREYEYIALPIKFFLNQLNVVNELINKSRPTGQEKRPSFVDVGCGLGSKLVIASQTFAYDKVYGIEISKQYVDVANKFTKRFCGNAEIIAMNAMEVDYSKYDVIYFYSPMVDRELQCKLELQIASTAKPGAFILANYYKNLPLWKKLCDSIWKANRRGRWSWLDSAIFKKKQS